jgi:hypothetical protein
MIELRERFLIVFATAPNAGQGKPRSIDSAVEEPDVQTLPSPPREVGQELLDGRWEPSGQATTGQTF